MIALRTGWSRIGLHGRRLAGVISLDEPGHQREGFRRAIGVVRTGRPEGPRMTLFSVVDPARGPRASFTVRRRMAVDADDLAHGSGRANELFMGFHGRLAAARARETHAEN